MKLKAKIIAFLSTAAAFVAMIFALVFNIKGKKKIMADYENLKEEKDVIQETAEKYVEKKKEYLELNSKSKAGSDDAAFTSSLDMLHKLSGDGKRRNGQGKE